MQMVLIVQLNEGQIKNCDKKVCSPTSLNLMSGASETAWFVAGVQGARSESKRSKVAFAN
jgi:hypothetical protein